MFRCILKLNGGSEILLYIVVRTNDVSALGIYRSLKAEIDRLPYIASVRWPNMPFSLSDIEFNSEFVVEIGNPANDYNDSKDRFLQLLRSFGRDSEKIRLIASSDTALEFLVNLRRENVISDDMIYPSGTLVSIAELIDKNLVARRLNSVVGDAFGACFGLPLSGFQDTKVVLKPARKYLTNSFLTRFGQKAVVMPAYEVASFLSSNDIDPRDVFLQRFFEIATEMPSYFFCHDGKIQFGVSAEKHFVFPLFGTAHGLLLKDVPREEYRVSVAIANELGWCGPLMIEFCRERSGAVRIIEINFRPWLLNEGFRLNGYNFICGSHSPGPRRPFVWMRGIANLDSGVRERIFSEVEKSSLFTNFVDVEYAASGSITRSFLVRLLKNRGCPEPLIEIMRSNFVA